MENNPKITIEAVIDAPIEKIWEYWTKPEHIVNWCNASEDWCAPSAINDLRVGGTFVTRMEAKDKSAGFDFGGKYDLVKKNENIEYTMDDGRKVKIEFIKQDNKTKVIETFDAETENSLEMQKNGWQSILNNFKKYTENKNKQKLHFQIEINALVEKVFKTMFNKEDYKKWTKAFNPTSDYEGSWEKGSKILFIGVDEKGNRGGMVSRIKENIPNKFLSIEHQGILEDNKEVLSGPKVEGWQGATENYTFSEKDGKTNLSVDIDSTKEFKEYFEETWPTALKILKEICEVKN